MFSTRYSITISPPGFAGGKRFGNDLLDVCQVPLNGEDYNSEQCREPARRRADAAGRAGALPRWE